MTTNEEEVVALTHIPPASSGAPLPVVISNEDDLYCAYRVHQTPEGWDGTTSVVKSMRSGNESIAVLTFPRFHAYQFGPPNDECFSGHPLYKKGLRPYGAYEIKYSSWIAYFEKINAVHPNHRKDRFDPYKHFVFSFHDTTLEVVAEKYEVETMTGSIREAVCSIQEKLTSD